MEMNMDKKKITKWIGTALEMIVFAFLIVIALGYVLGYRASLVIGWSSEPNIHYQSLVIDYKCAYEDLRVGDYITFKVGSSLTTHMIVAIAGRGDFESYGDTFKQGDTITFVNRGVKFERNISSECQIVTMATNYTNYEEYTQKTAEDSDFVVSDSSGSMVECVNYENVVGRVEHSLTNTGKFIIFVRNNFLQIVIYVIILYAGMLFFKYDEAYVKLF